MKKKQAIDYIRSCVDSNRPVTVCYEFTEENLPALLRLNGVDGHIDVPLKNYKDKLLAIEGDEVLTIGRLAQCDVVADHYENNLISRIHVIWQKVGDKYRCINCGIYGTTAFEEAPAGLLKIEPQSVVWQDFLVG